MSKCNTKGGSLATYEVGTPTTIAGWNTLYEVASHLNLDKLRTNYVTFDDGTKARVLYYKPCFYILGKGRGKLRGGETILRRHHIRHIKTNDVIRECRDTNPKVDLFGDGNYIGSTGWSRTVRDAVAVARDKFPQYTRITGSICKRGL